MKLEQLTKEELSIIAGGAIFPKTGPIGLPLKVISFFGEILKNNGNDPDVG